LASFPAGSGEREKDRERARVRKETAMPTPAGDTTILTPGEWVGYRVGRDTGEGAEGVERGEKGRETAADDARDSIADLELGGSRERQKERECMCARMHVFERENERVFLEWGGGVRRPRMMEKMPKATWSLLPIGKYPVPQSLPALPGWPPGALVRCCT